MSYRVVVEVEKDSRKSQVVRKLNTQTHGTKNLFKEGDSYISMGIDWHGTEAESRKKANEFIRG